MKEFQEGRPCSQAHTCLWFTIYQIGIYRKLFISLTLIPSPYIVNLSLIDGVPMPQTLKQAQVSSNSSPQDTSPIFKEKRSVKSQDEIVVYFRARKDKCNSVWCPSCSNIVWSRKVANDMLEFDWKRTREIVLTINPAMFKTPREAFEHVREHKLLSRFLRNIQRGKKVKIGKRWIPKHRPVEITRWMYFIEWHKDGRPHWHVIIETKQYGRFSMIGQDMIHHYWPVGKWIYESHISSLKHWQRKVGYFGLHGYFQDDKKHQTRLPEWSLNIPGLKIRRSSHSHRSGNTGIDLLEQCDDRTPPQILDPDTGEIFTPATLTYDRRFKLCGRCTFLTAYFKDKQIDGLFNIPYKQVRKDYPGQYREGTGYLFSLSEQEAKSLLADPLSMEHHFYLSAATHQPPELVVRWCHECSDRTYQKIDEVKPFIDLYTCLRCKHPCEHKSRH